MRASRAVPRAAAASKRGFRWCSSGGGNQDPGEVAKFRSIQRALRSEVLVDNAETQPLRGKAVLDVGCGGGLLSESLSRLGARVTAVDASSENVALARAHAAQDPNTRAIEYLDETADALLGRGRRFDVVCSLEVVEHVPDFRAFVATLSGLCQTGGVVAMSTLNRTPVSKLLAVQLAEDVLGLVPPGTHDWERFVKPQELVLALEEHGFREIDRSGMVYNPLANSWRLCEGDLRTNYILAARKVR